MAQENKAQSEIRYLNPVSVDVRKRNTAASRNSASDTWTTRTENS